MERRAGYQSRDRYPPLLSQYQQQMKTTGITDEQIVSVNFEELECEELMDYRKLYSYLKERLCAEKTTYKNLPCAGRHRGAERKY